MQTISNRQKNQLFYYRNSYFFIYVFFKKCLIFRWNIYLIKNYIFSSSCIEVSETAWFYLAFCSFFQDKPFYLRWWQNYLYQTFELRYPDFRKDFSKIPIPFCSSFLQVYYVSIYDGNIGPALLIYFWEVLYYFFFC